MLNSPYIKIPNLNQIQMYEIFLNHFKLYNLHCAFMKSVALGIQIFLVQKKISLKSV